jgi:hypothetical protein
LGKTPIRIRLPVQAQREASRFARHLAGLAERWLMAMRYTDRGLARLAALDFNDDPEWIDEDRRRRWAFQRKRFIDALVAEVQEISRTAEQFEVYEKIRATATPEDRELIAGKQREVFDKVNSGWKSFASKLMEDYEAVFAGMQSSRTSLSRTTEQLSLLSESHYDDFLTWKAKLAEISEEARQLELAKQSAHEQNTKTLADVQSVLKNTTEITNRILYEGPLLSECRQEFIDAKTKQLPSGSTEPAYFERRIDAFLSLVGDKPIAAYRVRRGC